MSQIYARVCYVIFLVILLAYNSELIDWFPWYKFHPDQIGLVIFNFFFLIGHLFLGGVFVGFSKKKRVNAWVIFLVCLGGHLGFSFWYTVFSKVGFVTIALTIPLIFFWPKMFIDKEFSNDSSQNILDDGVF